MPPTPRPVPRTWGESFAASLILLAVLALLSGLIYFIVLLWPHTLVAGRVGMALIALGTMVTFAVFAAALVFYTLPTLLGLRRPRGRPPEASP